MKKIVCFGLCFMIILCSFAFCFAMDITKEGSIYSLPTSRDSGLVFLDNGTAQSIAYSDSSDVFFTMFRNGTNNNEIAFSTSPGRVYYVYNSSNDSIRTYSLSDYSDGYYYARSYNYNDSSAILVNYYSYSGDFDISTALGIVSTYVDMGSITSNIDNLVNGSVSWLSSMAQAVKTNGLLLFFVLFIFVGVGIGLFKRFTN